MRVVFFGYQTWGYRTLQALIDLGHEVVLAVTHPTSDESYKAIWSAPVDQLARDHGIPAHCTKRVDEETIDLVKSVEPDVIVVNSWYNRMPVELYDLPPHGTLNFHDSLLPRFTGFSPVLWALISGESEFGLTVHRMDSGLDTGDILVQRSVPIGPTDTGTELVLRGMELIPDVLAEALSALESGSAVWRPQNKSERTFCHKRSERDSALDWARPAEVLERFVRALSDPYPRAFTYYNTERIEVLEARVSEARYGGTPGRVTVQEQGGAVVCGSDAYRAENRGLVITRIRCADGSEVSGEEYFRRGGYLYSGN
ncbi:methionyl-tRNA formyltransferase [Mycobacteroides immunogenum]|uniref:Methionyl-tRNA formyltransferase n=1 Tax=Mycobacteroides immunogenum TaxID=83262 RepID=A0A7V8RUK0_9MYCO|nr:methionyl-tRNA formyltransferase [Mycobacteroides immunogenum]AMT70909.1 methionyl-tRNA formyltransferase [Mycobacteroides immunogenum]ANO04017.1 methionyl-tRNA formyltransferase [Mycobacteroides immunogenum]KIU39496.1 methionyl-tRNA formyltransferase [Mycobacteroides immunogenum]KPG03969.1 methionyl-tRNA formyltransferase [Mycobacteroides immunogenum]KPG04452.1 methionyl-tRNA formyltransferase [Mycobacteroides immunogenum]